MQGMSGAPEAEVLRNIDVGRKVDMVEDHGNVGNWDSPKGSEVPEPYKRSAVKVLQAWELPCSYPRLNHRTRWADDPWVNASGTT